MLANESAAQRFYESFTAAAVDVSQFPVQETTLRGVRGYRGVSIHPGG